MSSKSPIKVLKEAYEVGKYTFEEYAHEYSPRKFTQPQLFACLVLKAFFCMDYRGICEVLKDCGDFRQAIGLKSVPHFTTLQKHSKELLRLPMARNLLESTLVRAKKKGRVELSWRVLILLGLSLIMSVNIFCIARVRAEVPYLRVFTPNSR